MNKLLQPIDSKVITLSYIPFESIKKLSDLLESWNGQSFDENLIEDLASDENLSFLSQLLVINLNPIPFRSLLRIILHRFKGNLAVLEDPYVEMEFWDTYAYFHSRSFLHRRKICWRLHFFHRNTSETNNIDSSQIINILKNGANQEEIEENGFQYLGFTTIRPTTSFNMGRTAIGFDTSPGGRAQDGNDIVEKDGVPFCKGKAKQEAHVLATKFVIDTVPFLQQDPVVGMCATASLWVTSQVLASKFDLHKYPYIDISRQATQPTLAPFIASPPDDTSDFARGLSAPEICGALIRTGAVPLVIIPRLFPNPELGRAHVQDQLYTFVESELPVIVCLTKKGQRVGHAVAAVGHLLPNSKAITNVDKCTVAEAVLKGSKEQYLVSQFITRYYVHNDSYGPFDRLDFLRFEDLNEDEKGQYTCPVILSRDPDRIYDIRSLIIPIPPYVKNRPDFILQDAVIRFNMLFYDDLIKDTGRTVLWRMLLVKASRFKQSLIERKWPEALIRKYAETHLPKYIWLCEVTITTKDTVTQDLSSTKSRIVHGEIIFDTTSAHYHSRAVVTRFGDFFITDSDIHSLPDPERLSKLEESRIDGISFKDTLPCFYGTAHD